MTNSEPIRRLAYLYSRYPVISQTFCDSEMLALEERGFGLDIASINPPPSTIRHERFEKLQAEVFYPPPSKVMQALQKRREKDGSWERRFGGMIARHDADYGESFKSATRARNALYFAELFERRGVEHFHVHFANRATHTALFIKQWSGIPFSFTPHAQDFMVDLGSDDLLREMCREAEFVVAVSDFSRDILRETCPESADKIERVYNGITMVDFPQAPISSEGPLKIITIGRLIEFKGFHHLIEACAKLGEAGVGYECCIIGEGPWRERLVDLAKELGVDDHIEFAGVQTQEEVKRRLQASDVFALPCIVDSKGASDILPTVITESMACCLPIVSTQLVGVPEMVDDGETGILVEPGDADAFAEALKRLAGDRDLARSMGKAGREKALKVFELEITSGELAEKFEKALEAGDRKVKKQGEAPILYLVDLAKELG
ncbi:MAG: glycosyltransferase family 4 protein, partial [Verrucomicrobia bacterium]|nr:glycosyltransferase family 4 protein [Verrucomicrobiota bacterium]